MQLLEWESKQAETCDIEEFPGYHYARADLTEQYLEEFYKHEPVIWHDAPSPDDRHNLAEYTEAKCAPRGYVKGLYTQNAKHSATIPYRFPYGPGLKVKPSHNLHIYNEVLMSNIKKLKALENADFMYKEDLVGAVTSTFLNHYFKPSAHYGVYPESRALNESKGKADFRVKVLKDKNLRTPTDLDFTSTIVEVKTTTGDYPYAGVAQLTGYYDETVANNPAMNTNSQNQANNMRHYAILICGTKIAFFCIDEILWNRGDDYVFKYANGDHAGAFCMQLGERGIEVIPHRACFNSPSKWYDLAWDDALQHAIPITALASYLPMTSIPPSRSCVNPNVLL